MTGEGVDWKWELIDPGSGPLKRRRVALPDKPPALDGRDPAPGPGRGGRPAGEQGGHPHNLEIPRASAPE